MFFRFFILFFFLCTLRLSAVTVNTVADGNWTDAFAWNGNQVPTNVDTIRVRHYITLIQNLTISAPTVLFIESSGTICGSFQFETLCGASLINYGHLYLNQIKTRAGYNYREIECKSSIVISGCPPDGSGYFHSVPPGGTVKVWPPVLCKTTDTNWELGIIGISELDSSPFKLYPNPLQQENLTIFTGTRTWVKVKTLEGNSLISHSFENETEVFLGHLQAGVYLVEIVTLQGVFRKKIIKTQ